MELSTWATKFFYDVVRVPTYIKTEMRTILR